MTGRIRTIKPSFFTHEELYDAEKETGLPIRVAFAGLFTQADKEGRFEWRPRRLKTDILPYDDVDFSRVLDALATRGWVVKYACGSREFGVIPTWQEHQHVNNRERESELPPPPEPIETVDELTRAPRVDDACPTVQGNSEAEREGEREVDSEPIGSGAPSAPAENPPDLKSQIFGPCLAWLSRQTGKPVSKLRPMVGRWCSRYGDGGTLDGLVAAARASPVDPIAWIEGILNGKAKPPGYGQRFSTSDLAKLLVDDERAEQGNGAAHGDPEPDHALPRPEPRRNGGAGPAVPERDHRGRGADAPDGG